MVISKRSNNCFLLIFLIILGCDNKEEERDREPRKIPVIIATVKKSEIKEMLQTKGTLFSETKAIISPKMAGKIDQILFDEGAEVKADQILGKLEDTQYILAEKKAQQNLLHQQALLVVNKAVIAQKQALLIERNSGYEMAQAELTRTKSVIKQAEAGLAASVARINQAQANFEKVQDDYMRMQRLFEKESIPKQKYDHALAASQSATAALNEAKASKDQAEAYLSQAQASFEQASIGVKNAAARKEQAQADLDQAIAQNKQTEIGVDEAKVSLDIAKTTLDDTKIISPISGVITKRNMDLGEMGAPGKSIFTVEKTDLIKVKADISSLYLSQIDVGTPVDIYIEGVENSISAKINEISPEVDQVSRMFEVKIHIDNKEKKLKPGLFARINVVLKSVPSGIILPSEAVIKREGKKIVYTVTENMAYQREITEGIRQGSMSQILSGLKEGEKVVIEGQNNLYDKCHVLIQGGE